jgi:hypothetical protein
MICVTKDWNPKQALLKSIILIADRNEEVKNLLLELHSMVHSSKMSNIDLTTFEDELWDGLEQKAFSVLFPNKDTTIAWNIWHITRIEDITSNILIADEKQVINSDNWLEKMNVSICDTGNAMTNEEIASFSELINMEELKNYRVAVGRRSQEIIRSLKYEDLKRKIAADRTKRILTEGGVTEHENSRWLLDFWGRKNVAGILQMPTTRHQIVHINDSLKIKERWAKNNRKETKINLLRG